MKKAEGDNLKRFWSSIDVRIRIEEEKKKVMGFFRALLLTYWLHPCVSVCEREII
jgi:hypothetical protein